MPPNRTKGRGGGGRCPGRLFGGWLKVIAVVLLRLINSPSTRKDNSVLPAMKHCLFQLSQISLASIISEPGRVNRICSVTLAASRKIFCLAAFLVVILGQISSLHAANNVGECYVTANVTGGTLPAGWSYQLQYYDTYSSWHDGAEGNITQTYYKQQGDWANRSIPWRCQLKLNNSNYGTPQASTYFAGSSSVAFSVSAPALGTAPTITSNPASQSIQSGASVTFTVNVNGTTPMNYQWRKMSGAMDGAAMFFGHKTIFFARKRDASPRMAKVSKAILGLTWLDTEYNEFLAELNERQMSELEARIWPIS